jgi:hypothetical protein
MLELLLVLVLAEQSSIVVVRSNGNVSMQFVLLRGRAVSCSGLLTDRAPALDTARRIVSCNL